MVTKFEYLPETVRRHRHTNTRVNSEPRDWRTRVMFLGVVFLFFVIALRLGYWQVLNRSRLQAEAEDQYSRTTQQAAERGKILSQDGFALVINQKMYRLFVQPPVMKQPPAQVAKLLTPILLEVKPEEATDSAKVKALSDELELTLNGKLSQSQQKWVAVRQRVNESQKKQIEELKITGLGFDQYLARSYPEASLSAHVVGFVGKNEAGEDQGYFGIEGALNQELKGVSTQQTRLKDALGLPLLFDSSKVGGPVVGRDVVLSIRRDVQFAVEEMLKEGMEKYDAVSGEVIIMDPKTGKVLALAAFPNYNPEKFYQFDPSVYKNPSITDVFEPGSIFKVLTVAAGIDAGVIDADTQCTTCSSARKIGSYTIKTWNDVYNPNISMKDALAKSDNTAMIFVSDLLGEDRFVEYVKKFGIGEATQVEMQEDTSTPMRQDWKPIDLATSSFGQGIATTGLQMVRAVGAIANGGKLMKMSVIDKVTDPITQAQMQVQPQEEAQVIKPETAKTVTGMMEYSAAHGEAQWIAAKTHNVAGKTGTAQIPIDGHYDDTKTIASFIGFAPANNPRFVMLVKLREPKSSPWAAETAAPLWYNIASKLYLLLNIPPEPATPAN